MNKPHFLFILIALIQTYGSAVFAGIDDCVIKNLDALKKSDPDLGDLDSFKNNYDFGTPEAAKRAQEIKARRLEYGLEAIKTEKVGSTGVIKFKNGKFGDGSPPGELVRITQHGSGSDVFEAEYVTGEKVGQKVSFTTGEVWKWDDNYNSKWRESTKTRDSARKQGDYTQAFKSGGSVIGEDIATIGLKDNFGLPKDSEKTVTFLLRQDSDNFKDPSYGVLNNPSLASPTQVRYVGKDALNRSMYQERVRGYSGEIEAGDTIYADPGRSTLYYETGTEKNYMRLIGVDFKPTPK